MRVSNYLSIPLSNPRQYLGYLSLLLSLLTGTPCLS